MLGRHKLGAPFPGLALVVERFECAVGGDRRTDNDLSHFLSWGLQQS